MNERGDSVRIASEPATFTVRRFLPKQEKYSLSYMHLQNV